MFLLAPRCNNNAKRAVHAVMLRHQSISTILLLLLTLALAMAPVNAQGGSDQGSQSPPASSAVSSSSFVLADPNNDASAFSPPAEPSPIVPASQNVAQNEQIQSDDQNQQTAATKPGTGGYGAMMMMPSVDVQKDADSMNDTPSSQQSSEPNTAKGRQFNQFAVPAAPFPEAGGLMGGIGLGPGPAAGNCPGGASLNIECDPKRPWPQCPPQSYCYATNTVDIGPYFCCPVWSTYGAAWRPATPFYAYAPPPPPNWPEPMRMAAAPWAAGGPIRKERRDKPFDADGETEATTGGGAETKALTEDEQRKIVQVMNDWVERQKAVPMPPADTNKGTKNVTAANLSSKKNN